MAYTHTFKQLFLDHLIGLSRTAQKQCLKAVEKLCADPTNTSNKNLEQLKHWKRLWSYRVNDGDRVLYAVHGSVIQLLDVGSHDYIYNKAAPKIDQYDDLGGQAFDFSVIEDVLDPTSATTAAQVPHYPRPKQVLPPQEPTGEKIPMAITQEVLARFQVPAQYQRALLAAVTEDDLLEAVGDNQPLFQTLYNWLYNQPGLPDIAQQPDFVLSHAGDLERFLKGDLLAFLLYLDPEQRALVDFSLKGPTLVKGGPGSGKSTVALYRIRELFENPPLPGLEPRILFTTYTKALIKSSEQQLAQLMGELPENVTVSTLDRIARRIVCDVENKRYIKMADDENWHDALGTARTILSRDAPDSLAAKLLNPYETRFAESYLIDEIQWVIEGQGLDSVDDYLQIQRTGRTYPLQPDLRRAVWRIYELVRDHFAANHLVSWDGLRRLALQYVEDGQYTDRYDYVLVDEAQDLTPVQLQLCLQLCHSPAGLFLTADQSQSIYNKGFSWQRVHDGLRVAGRTRHLKRNYRTTLEIADAAYRFMHKTEAGDAETLTQRYVHRGTLPVVFAAPQSSDQARWLADALRQAAQSINKGLEAVAVLVPNKELGYRLNAEFSACQTPSMVLSSGDDFDWNVNAIKIMTMHSAKGLEFPIVALPFVEAGTLPRDLELGAQDYGEKLAEQRRLFYVAATRAMRYLFVTHTAAHPSAFIDELSREHWQFVRP